MAEDTSFPPKSTKERAEELRVQRAAKALGLKAEDLASVIPSAPLGNDPNPVDPPLVDGTFKAQAGPDTNPVAPVTPEGNLSEAIKASGIDPTVLEAELDRILKEKVEARKRAFDPKEPDYSSLKEEDYYNPDFYIPVITHDIPDYMHVKLKDTSYVPVWASLDQRRIGQLLAEGYEPLRKEHVAPGFALPLKFNSEGMYIYQDVVCLRVHKRIKVAKLRKIQEVSTGQLKKAGADARIKSKLVDAVLGDPYLESAFLSKGLGFYEPTT